MRGSLQCGHPRRARKKKTRKESTRASISISHRRHEGVNRNSDPPSLESRSPGPVQCFLEVTDHDMRVFLASWWSTQVSSSSKARENATDASCKLHSRVLHPKCNVAAKVKTTRAKQKAGFPAKQSDRASQATCTASRRDLTIWYCLCASFLSLSQWTLTLLPRAFQSRSKLVHFELPARVPSVDPMDNLSPLQYPYTSPLGSVAATIMAMTLFRCKTFTLGPPIVCAVTLLRFCTPDSSASISASICAGIPSPTSRPAD